MTRRQAILAGTFVVGLVLFAQSLTALGRARVVEGLVRVGWGFPAILALAGVRELVRAVAWTRTVEGPVPLGLAQALRARLAGEALNTLVPMGIVVGEPAKASRAADVPFATAFKGLAVEFAFYSASLVVLFAAGASAFVAVAAVPSWLYAVLVIAVIVSAAASALLYGWRRNVALQRVQDTVLGFARRHPEHLRPIVACEIAYHLLGVAEVYVTLLLISPSTPTVASAVVLETVSRAITMAFKVLPMRVGVDEVSSSIFAARVDLDAATGLTLALVRKLRLLFWAAIGLAMLIGKAPSPAPAVAE